MSEFFRAHQAVGTTIPTYFIESTAPNNVDDLDQPAPPLPPQLQPIDSDLAIEHIAKVLASAPDPNLVVMVHGFNNPEPDVLNTYAAAARAIEHDPEIVRRPGLVCVGYRWPSEKMGQPWKGTWDALPTLPTWILYWGAALAVLSYPLFWLVSRLAPGWAEALRWIWNPFGLHAVTVVGGILAGLVLTAALLRTIVYFRDTYRASNYGVPDLIQIIRAIDGKLVELGGPRGALAEHEHRAQLSFIGHSMGGFVVTNALRTLSDVFTTRVKSLSMFGAAAGGGAAQPPSPNIGHGLRLVRFVLASPDIPAETLLSNRGNFLAEMLVRFKEAYLFSNEGDEVLRQISTLANYFVFPTKSRNHGFRLGNVEILSRNFGLIDVPGRNFLRTLRIGKYTLQELYDVLEDARTARRGGTPPKSTQTLLPRIFTYFDCTDYVDSDRDGGTPRPLLTFAKCRKRDDATAKLRWYSHLHLLFAYLFRHQKPNVHGGYFEGQLSQQLIYRLACLGFDDTVAAYGGEGAMSSACAAKQIRALVSPDLRRRLLAGAAPAVVTAAPASSLTVAVAASGIEVPELIGMSIDAALEKLRVACGQQADPPADPAQGSQPLLVMEIAELSPAPPGKVLRQTPDPGSRVKPGNAIELVVARR